MTHVTKRGEILVLGCDEVYPVASASDEAYRRRFVAPFETAMLSTDPAHPLDFAVPGNQDWYDSLVSFTRRFIGCRWFAGWASGPEQASGRKWRSPGLARRSRLEFDHADSASGGTFNLAMWCQGMTARLDAMGRFGRMFMGALWDVFINKRLPGG